MNLGTNDYLTKPIDLPLALARIGTQLSNKPAQGTQLDGQRTTEPHVRGQRYIPRYPFTADAEIVDLKSGTRVKGVTSDLSLVGCFVCTRRLPEIGTRIRLTLTRKGQNITMPGVVRVVKPEMGMGIEFLDVDQNCNKNLVAWFESLRESR